MTTFKVHVVIKFFRVPPSKHKSLKITVYDSDESLIVKACGSTPPDLIMSSSNSLSIVFKTDGSRNATGFKALWSTEKNISSIKSPNYPRLYPANNADQVLK